MSHCYSCDDPITEENKSDEHIIPDVFGGRLRSADILCRKCNSTFGSEVEKSLNEYGIAKCIQFKINRDSGKSPSVTLVDDTHGIAVHLSSNGIVKQLEPTVTYNQDGTFEISAINEKRAEQELKKIIKEYSEKGMRVDTSKMEIKIVNTDNKTHISHNVNLVTHNYHKTILRIFIGYYVSKNLDKIHLQKVISFVKDKENKTPNVFNLPCLLNFSHSFHDNKPYHILILHGNKKKKYIAGYCELFGELGNISVLNPRYEGKDFTLEYTFDPITLNIIKHSNYPFTPNIESILNKIIFQNTPTGNVRLLNES